MTEKLEKPTPKPHSSFTVSSGCLCYGHLHNMCHGLTLPPQPFPNAVEWHIDGTVKSQTVHYNITALNGTWRAYELVDSRSGERTAWFVCHDSVSPETEVDKMLRVSGSPYEFDSGSQWHSDETVEEGVLPINRYDWGYYDERCKDEASDDSDQSDHLFSGEEEGESLGLVDCAHARDYIGLWKDVPPPQRESQAHGLWMDVMGEYMFGRFGFTDDHKAARSFFWFTTCTEFAFTTFAGLETTLRVFESDQDRMSRLLREGFNMDGLELVQSELQEHQQSGTVPPDDGLRGPHEAADYILDAQDADLIASRAHGPPPNPADEPMPHLSAYWRSACLEVINEALLSYLDSLVTLTSHSSSADDDTVSKESIAASLFPKHHDQENTVDKWMYTAIMDPRSSPSVITSREAFADKISAFLHSRSDGRDLGMLRVEGFIQGLAAAVEFLCGEMLELAGNSAMDHCRNGAIVPLDIRLSIRNDEELMAMVGCSRVYWMGGTRGWVDAASEV
ncbi:hypothetical protein BB8028_0002g08520 [Beauveria bassiana]|uniref:Histone H2A n=1 Tax=Beauveria bassiana TaxID=176275 RepID=A0A2S7Y357_BEABA|nr:hypothetical protein BB8028_0002g08520 [Beauveria bassiana]